MRRARPTPARLAQAQSEAFREARKHYQSRAAGADDSLRDGPHAVTEDGKLLQFPSAEAGDFTHTDTWRVLRIMGELIEAFDTLASLDKAVAIFGSARVLPDHPQYRAAEETAYRLAQRGSAIIARAATAARAMREHRLVWVSKWGLAVALAWAVTSCAPADRLTASDADVARDPRTRLEWTRHDYPQSLPWDDADQHCRELAIGDRRGWRLPEIGEVQALYDGKRFTEPCGDRTCHFDPAIQLGGPYLWSATAREQGSRFYFDASAGNSFSPGVTPRLVRRVICVRNAN